MNEMALIRTEPRPDQPSEVTISRIATVEPKEIKYVKLQTRDDKPENKTQVLIMFDYQFEGDEEPNEYTVTVTSLGGLGSIGNNCYLDIIQTSVAYPNDPSRGTDSNYFCLLRNPNKSIPPLTTSTFSKKGW